VKIGDFGISKRAEEVSSTLKGTWGFFAPELLGLIKAGNESRPRNAQAADMWSLGEIAFRMLTGEPTFRNVGLLAAYVQMPENFPSNTLFAHGVNIEGCDFLKRVMVPTPEKRMTVEDALLHNWMEPQRSPGSRPSSTVFKRYEEFSIWTPTSNSDWAQLTHFTRNINT
jgi:serine/threonine protein kinase